MWATLTVAKTISANAGIAYALTPETFEDAVNLLVPELQKRGVYKTEYRQGTLREKLFGKGPRLELPHPGASYRDLGRVSQAWSDNAAIEDLTA